MSPMMTCAPSSTHSCAVALPIPVEPPDLLVCMQFGSFECKLTCDDNDFVLDTAKCVVRDREISHDLVTVG